MNINETIPYSDKFFEDMQRFRPHRFSVNACLLRVIDGPILGLETVLNSAITRIGRADWCDLVLSNDQYISKDHCEINLTGTDIIIQDKSYNGTYIGNNRIIKAYLNLGDKFRIGQSTIQLVSLEKKQDIFVYNCDDTGRIVGQSDSMRDIFDMLRRLKETGKEISILLTGATGTGKSLIAEAIHKQSPRAHQPFVTVDCGALPKELIESALFGHKKGAFTGSITDQDGYIKQANGGTLFLDEIGELSLELQPKLLRALEAGIIRPLGAVQDIRVDFRLIAATNRNLEHEVKHGKFREDLYYRIAVVELNIPLLQNRLEDIPLIVKSMLSQLFFKSGGTITYQITDNAIRKLQQHSWPGNIRELRNVIERTTALLKGDIIDADDIKLSPTNILKLDSKLIRAQLESGLSHKDIIESFERELISEAISLAKGNVQEAATILHIPLSTLYEKRKKLGLSSRITE
jgi:DNA-binding NtrC family response regulator